MRHPHTVPAMPIDVDEYVDPDTPTIGKPTKTSFMIRQVVEFVFFICLTICIIISSLVYITLVTFTILPLGMISRQWRNISAWYIAPLQLQCHFYRFYRKNSKRLSSEWDIEKAKPTPLAQLRRSFFSQEWIIPPQVRSNEFTKLPAEIRLQIYKEVIVGSSTHVHIAVHQTKKPGRKRSTSRIHGSLCSHRITKAPIMDCKCFDIGSCGPTIPRCQTPYSEASGRGILALSKTSKQIYMETIGLLYSQSCRSPIVC